MNLRHIFWDRAIGGDDRFDVREEVCEENGRINGDALVFSFNHLSTIYWVEKQGGKGLKGKNQEFCFKYVILGSLDRHHLHTDGK